MVKKAPSAGAGERARTLRRDMTEAERRLWQILRSRQTEDCRFRRQVPIGGFIVDFACHAARLIVEIDGGQQVLENPQGVRAAIAENLQRVTRTDVEPLTPTPTLPHHGGGSESTPEDPADPAQLIPICGVSLPHAEPSATRGANTRPRPALHTLPLDGGGTRWG